MNNEILKEFLKTLSILYIEDEQDIRNNLVQTLEIIFKKVIAVETAEEAQAFYESEKIDIILSDIFLPKMSGIEFAQLIRQNNTNIPIILLSAHTDTSILLEATKLKLINYLVKPIGFKDLYQTCLNVANELIQDNNIYIKFKNGMIYDTIKNLLFSKNNEIIDLTAHEYKFLNILIKNQGKVVLYEHIIDYVWEDPYNTTQSAFKSLLNKLRKKIGINTIKNINGVGYRLIIE